MKDDFFSQNLQPVSPTYSFTLLIKVLKITESNKTNFSSDQTELKSPERWLQTPVTFVMPTEKPPEHRGFS